MKLSKKLIFIPLSSLLIFGCGQETPTIAQKPVPVGKSVAITDTDTHDTGELRYYLPTDQMAGQINVSIKYPANAGESAYVSLFDPSHSTDKLIAGVRLDDGAILLRGVNNLVTTFTPGEWVDIAINWDTSDIMKAGQYTLYINGINTGTYTSQNTTPDVKVSAVSIRLSSNSGTAKSALYVDNFAVYADDATTKIFSDNYDNRAVGTKLGKKGGDYNRASFSAVVTDKENAPSK